MSNQYQKQSFAKWMALLALPFGLAGCHTDMWKQAKVRAYHESPAFQYDQGSRPIEANTVAQGHLRIDDHLYKGVVNNKPVDTFPFPITKEILERGRDRFETMCSHCHGAVGYGDGMVAKRGFASVKLPADYHTDYFRNIPVGHFFDVMTNGLGIMLGIPENVEPKDRWAIAAYIRTLQLSQNYKYSDLTPQEIAELNKSESQPKSNVQAKKGTH